MLISHAEYPGDEGPGIEDEKPNTVVRPAAGIFISLCRKPRHLWRRWMSRNEAKKKYLDDTPRYIAGGFISQKRYALTFFFSLFLSLVFLLGLEKNGWVSYAHWKIYDGLLFLKKRSGPPPSSIRDIVLVMIDNKTIQEMPHRWPYPRADFARVIGHLREAQPRVIAFDFSFFGASSEKDDQLLSSEIKKARVILATMINEDGTLAFPTLPYLGQDALSGIVTKIQDKDRVTRRNLTYLVNAADQQQGFLSWEMRILKEAVGLDLSSVTNEDENIELSGHSEKTWRIPMDHTTNSFLINYSANTREFPHLSFYDVYRGTFDTGLIKNRIVLVGLFSSLLSDIHNTPIGWIPGTTLNANALLTLYHRDFLRALPHSYEILPTLLGVLVTCFFIGRLRKQWLFWLVVLEIALFFSGSYYLLKAGWVWNYFLPPFVLAAGPLLGWKISRLGEPKKATI